MLEHGNSRYCTYYNGEYTQVDPLEDCVRAILCRNKIDEDKIKRLEEENKKLKEEVWKDEELQKMKSDLERMRADYRRGFSITEDEEKRIKEWKQKHDEEVHGVRYDVPSYKMRSGGNYSYHFYPTSIGTSGVIRCSCGAEFEFCKLG